MQRTQQEVAPLPKNAWNSRKRDGRKRRPANIPASPHGTSKPRPFITGYVPAHQNAAGGPGRMAEPDISAEETGKHAFSGTMLSRAQKAALFRQRNRTLPLLRERAEFPGLPASPPPQKRAQAAKGASSRLDATGEMPQRQAACLQHGTKNTRPSRQGGHFSCAQGNLNEKADAGAVKSTSPACGEHPCPEDGAEGPRQYSSAGGEHPQRYFPCVRGTSRSVGALPAKNAAPLPQKCARPRSSGNGAEKNGTAAPSGPDTRSL